MVSESVALVTQPQLLISSLDVSGVPSLSVEPSLSPTSISLAAMALFPVPAMASCEGLLSDRYSQGVVADGQKLNSGRSSF